jgi:hypothetical protein
MDEDGDPAVREDLKGLAADQDRRNAASMCEAMKMRSQLLLPAVSMIAL